MSADVLLSRLEGVRRSGRGWIARCPAHADRTPSLSITEGDVGTLVHCFGGCPTADVLAAVGLSVADLFAARLADRAPLSRADRRRLMSEADWAAALDRIAVEASVVEAAAHAVRDGVMIDAVDLTRLREAIERIRNCRAVLAGREVLA